MAAASYTTDLALICGMETGDSFEEFSGYALGDNAALETDWYLQGASCASDEANSKTGVGHSIGYDYGSQITFATGDCFFGWMQCMAGNAMDTFANGGYRVLIGSTTSDYDGWAVGGRDFGRNPYGGWTNIAVDPTHTADYTLGTSTGYQHFGVAFNLTSAIGKGRPNNADVYRYGRGELIIEHGDLGNGYGIFSGIAIQNDSQDNRWGLLQPEGAGYLWKGLMSFGNVTNACDFRDSNVSITVENTPKTYAAFNKIEVNNISSRVDWTGINITALLSTQLSLGSFEMIDDAAVNFDTCNFTDMSTWIFDSNALIYNTTFRRSGQVTQALGTFTDCVFDKSAAAVALVVDDLSEITGCQFVSDGTGHAVNLGTVAATTSMPWSNTESGYAIQTGTAADRTILVNVASGQVLTINVGTGASTPTYYNTGTGTVTVVSSFDHILIGLELNTEVTYVTAGTSTELFHVEETTTSDGAGKYKTTYAHGGGATVDILIHHINYLPDISNIYSLTLPSSDTTVKVAMFDDPNYLNP